MTKINVSGVALGFVILAAIFMYPPDYELVHNTQGSISDNYVTQENIETVHFNNLSDRAQELYVNTLQAGGEYRVANNEGAPDISYPTPSEWNEEASGPPRFDEQPGATVIERPEDNSDLPPADESESMGTQFEVFTTSSERPSVTSWEWYPRYFGGIVGLALIVGNLYLIYTKKS